MSKTPKGSEEFEKFTDQKLCSYVILMRDDLTEDDKEIISKIASERLSNQAFSPELERVRLELESVT